MPKPVIITCAPAGGVHTPTMSPHLPVTPDEIAAASVEAARAGAGDCAGPPGVRRRCSTSARDREASAPSASGTPTASTAGGTTWAGRIWTRPTAARPAEGLTAAKSGDLDALAARRDAMIVSAVLAAGRVKGDMPSPA